MTDPRTDFKAAWLRQIQGAYANLLWRNGLGRLHPAGLALMNDKGLWGRWDDRRRIIFISEDLILNHPWPVTLGILGHEVAHQLVSDLGGFEDRAQSPHGPAFQRMGRRLGLDDFYLKAQVDLRNQGPEVKPDQPPESEAGQQVLMKVKKLLALSGSPVAAEAQAAMNAAARLMAKHNLKALENQEEKAYEHRLIGPPVKRLSTALALTAGLLNRHFFVETIFVPDYDPRTDTESKRLEIMGRPENVSLAEHVFLFLSERSESLWREYRREHKGGGQAARNSFIAGLLEGFDAKLKAEARAGGHSKSPNEGFSALVLSRDARLADFVRYRHPRLKTVATGRGRRHCPQSDAAGRRAGQALTINSPLTSNNQPPAGPRLLAG